MGMTAIPNPKAPASPVTDCPSSEFQIFGGQSISQAHPSDATPTGGPSGTISVVDADGALRT